MIKKSMRPQPDLVLARLAIFGILAILFTILSLNAVTPWFLWVLMLIGVFSIFSAAIEAEDDAEAVKKLEKVVFNHLESFKAEKDEYKAIAENLEELYLRERKKTKGLRRQLERLGFKNNSGELMKPPLGQPPKWIVEQSFFGFETTSKLVDKRGDYSGLYSVEIIEGDKIHVFSHDSGCSFWALDYFYRLATTEEITVGERIDNEYEILKIRDSYKSIETSQDIVESILARSLDNPEIQDLCAQLLDLLDQSEGEKI